jgi:hypothetical protein
MFKNIKNMHSIFLWLRERLVKLEIINEAGRRIPIPLFDSPFKVAHDRWLNGNIKRKHK